MDIYECFYFDFMGFYGILAMLYRIINGLDGILCFFWHLTPGATGILLNMMGMPMIRLMDRSWIAGGFKCSYCFPSRDGFRGDDLKVTLLGMDKLTPPSRGMDTNHITESQVGVALNHGDTKKNPGNIWQHGHCKSSRLAQTA